MKHVEIRQCNFPSRKVNYLTQPKSIADSFAEVQANLIAFFRPNLLSLLKLLHSIIFHQRALVNIKIYFNKGIAYTISAQRLLNMPTQQHPGYLGTVLMYTRIDWDTSSLAPWSNLRPCNVACKDQDGVARGPARAGL